MKLKEIRSFLNENLQEVVIRKWNANIDETEETTCSDESVQDMRVINIYATASALVLEVEE